MTSPLLIMGAPRSGTTFLCHALNLHPQIALTNETRIFRWMAQSASLLGNADFCFHQNTEFYTLFSNLLPAMAKTVSSRDRQTRYWGDKNPHYALMPEPEVAALMQMMPDLKWLSIVRDPRDTFLSMTNLKWADEQGAMASWKDHVIGANRIKQACPPGSFYEVKYESLISHPDAAFLRIFEWLGLEPSNEVYAFLASETKRRIAINAPTRNNESFQKGYDRGRWPVEIKRDAMLALLDGLGDLMIEKGYETESSLAQQVSQTMACGSPTRGQKMKIGLLAIATNKYIKFVYPLWESVKRHFMTKTPHEVTMFVFTDQPDVPPGTVRIPHEHKPWPAPTLMRYHAFLKNQDQLKDQDYLYYCDADMLFVDDVGEEILGEVVATIHPGFYNKPRDQFSYETRPQSRAYMPPKCGTKYFAGGFNGGRTQRYLGMAKEITGWIDEDEKKGIVAVWHDESHMNKWLAGNPPTVELSPSYCYPESWDLPFSKKLLALDKNHAEMRS